MKTITEFTGIVLRQAAAIRRQMLPTETPKGEDAPPNPDAGAAPAATQGDVVQEAVLAGEGTAEEVIEAVVNA